MRKLAILTLLPLAGREEDYWDQAFVFEISKESKGDRQ